MKFTGAFEALGYVVESPRQDWSAISPTGVCITLWQKELRSDQGLPWFDTREHGDPYDVWKDKPGNNKRKKHLQEALSKFGGKVDVIIVNGLPGQGYGDAHPWFESDRKAYWHVDFFDSETGHLAVRVRKTSLDTSKEGQE